MDELRAAIIDALLDDLSMIGEPVDVTRRIAEAYNALPGAKPIDPKEYEV